MQRDRQRCGACKQLKSVLDFAPSYRGKPGTWCRSCFRDYSRGCLVKAKHEPITCLNCGTLYVPKQLKVAKHKGFCAQRCRDEFNKPRHRELRLLRDYGITPDDYDRMFTEQEGQCAICGKRPEEQKRYKTYLQVDHDHQTGKVRGLLCGDCNLLIGRFGDTSERLLKAANYLEKAAVSD